MDNMRDSEASLGVDYSMLYSIQMLSAAKDGGTKGDVGDSTTKPKNINVLINI